MGRRVESVTKRYSRVEPTLDLGLCLRISGGRCIGGGHSERTSRQQLLFYQIESFKKKAKPQIARRPIGPRVSSHTQP